MLLRFGILGGGSWATALAKILTDNRHSINWWIRNEDVIAHLKQRRHNPHYLSSVYFDNSLLNLKSDIRNIVENSDILVVAVPSAFIEQALQPIDVNSIQAKKIVSAIKGILPAQPLL